jgi:phosphatidylglycerophosphatase A
VTFGWTGLIFAVFILFVIGIWASNGYITGLGGDDPGPVVIDEVAGQWLTLVPAAYLAPAPDLIIYGVSFVLFRIADILKPWPVSWADNTVHSGLGIMLDDIFAAVYASIALSIIIQYLGL